MKNYNYSSIRGMMAVLFGLFGIFGFAQKYTVDPVTVEAGKQAVVTVNIEDASRVVGGQFGIELPDGFSLVGEPKSLLNPRKYQLSWEESTMKLLFNSNNPMSTFVPDGPVLEFTISADEVGPTEKPVITLTNAIVSVNTGSTIMSDVKLGDIKVPVTVSSIYSPEATLSLSPGQITVNGDGTAKFALAISSNFEVSSLGLVLTLPEGMTFGGDLEDGLTDRVYLTTGLTYLPRTDRPAGAYGITLANMTTNISLEGTDGDFLIITVKGSENLAKDSEITITDAVASTVAGVAVNLNNLSVKVVNGKYAYDEACAVVAGLETALQDALAKIADTCPDVKDDFTGADITKQIQDLSGAVDAAYVDGSLNSNYDAVMAPADAISAAIDKLESDADAAEKQFLADQAAAANTQAHERMTSKLNDARQSLTDMLATIKKECPDVADQFPGTEISESIAAIEAELKASKDKGTCVADEKAITDKITALAEDVAALKAAADAAEKQFLADQAAAANNAAYERMTSKLNDARQSLTDMLATIKKEYPDVADRFLGTEISESISAIEAELNASNDKGTCAADEKTITDKIAALAEEIKTLKTEASSLQEIYSYNKSAHAAVIKEIDALQAELDAMKALVAEKYPDASVAVNIYVAQEAINKARTDADDELSDANENGTKFVYSYDADSIKKQIKEIEIAAKATGISDVILDGAEGISAVYTIDGQKIPAPVHGMNIIVTTHGKVKKVYVK